VFRRRGSGETWTEMAPSLLTAQWRRLLLLLAGDVETNPGPDPDYGGEYHDTIMVEILSITNL